MDNLLKKPLLVKDFVDTDLLNSMKKRIQELKASGKLFEDNSFFHRLKVRNDPVFQKIHHFFILPEAKKLIHENIVPTYSFLALYFEGRGICPIHLDKDYCQWTVDICLDQRKPWPLYIDSSHADENLENLNFETMSPDEKEIYHKASQEYLLNPGDALIYSGTKHPHWRKRIQPDNFCNLIFFHFNESGT